MSKPIAMSHRAKHVAVSNANLPAKAPTPPAGKPRAARVHHIADACPRCAFSGPHVMTDNPPHIGLQCGQCGSRIRWMTKAEKAQLAAPKPPKSAAESLPEAWRGNQFYSGDREATTEDQFTRVPTVTSLKIRRIRFLIELNGLSVHWLAGQLGVSKQSVYNWLDSIALPRDQTVLEKAITILEAKAKEDEAAALAMIQAESADAQRGIADRELSKRDHERDILAGHFLGWDLDATEAEIKKAYRIVDRMRSIGERAL